MHRKDFQNLARLRLKEARRLLASDLWCGAYYLGGLAVECAVKACICKTMKRHEFPPHNKHSQKCFQHDLWELVDTAGLANDLAANCTADPDFDLNWAVVRTWKVDARYDDKLDEVKARELLGAITAPQHGVLKWLRIHW
jgi:hypothetical protein